MPVVKALENNLSLVVPGSLILPSLITVFAMMLQHAGATTSDVDISTSAPSCPEENDACLNDAMCHDCIVGWSSGVGVDAYTECVVESASNSSASADPCDRWTAMPCCQDSLSSHDCLTGSRLFLEYWECDFDYLLALATYPEMAECAVFSCSDGSGRALVFDTDDLEDDTGVADDEADAAGGDHDASTVDDDTAGTADDDGDTGVLGDDAEVGDDDDAGARTDDDHSDDADRDTAGADDDTGAAADDAPAANEDAGVAADDDAGVLGDDAGAAGDDAGVVDDDAGVADDHTGVGGDDDAGTADDDDTANNVDHDAGDGTDEDTGGEGGESPIADEDAGVVVDDDAEEISDDAAAADDDDTGDPLGATSSSASSACSDEYSACGDDEMCYECLTGWAEADGAQEAFDECVSNSDLNEEDVCGWSSLTPCCVDSVSSSNCLGNSAYFEFWTCAVRDQGCTAITCDGTAFGDEVTSDAASSYPSTKLTNVLGLPLAAVAPFLSVAL